MLVFSSSFTWISFSDGVISLVSLKTFVITQCGYLLISLNVFLIWLSSFFRYFSIEQLIYALRTEVFKVPHFQLLHAKEYQFIYRSVHVFFLYTTVSIFPGFLIIKIYRKGMVLSFSISNMNFIFLCKELSASNMLSDVF